MEYLYKEWGGEPLQHVDDVMDCGSNTQVLSSHLGVGVGNAPVHQHHDEDSDGDAKVSDDPP